MLYPKGDNTRCPTLALRRLILPVLYNWLSTESNNLFDVLLESSSSETLSGVIAVELLRSPFYLCVALHIPTLLSVEMYH